MPTDLPPVPPSPCAYAAHWLIRYWLLAHSFFAIRAVNSLPDDERERVLKLMRAQIDDELLLIDASHRAAQ